jgi:hypothetical protein
VCSFLYSRVSAISCCDCAEFVRCLCGCGVVVFMSVASLVTCRVNMRTLKLQKVLSACCQLALPTSGVVACSGIGVTSYK